MSYSLTSNINMSLLYHASYQGNELSFYDRKDLFILNSIIKMLFRGTKMQILSMSRILDSKITSPFFRRFMQIDSWWYFKGEDQGLKNWTARPTQFPNGIKPTNDYTGWPVVAHNRWFASDTDYAQQNGGQIFLDINIFYVCS